MADAGKIAPTYEDEWSASVAYDFHSYVTHNGNCYIAKQPSTGVEPVDEENEYWFLALKNVSAEELSNLRKLIEELTNGTTPAGDSKKLDGLTKKEFVKGASPFFASGETILDWANNPNGVYNKMALTEIVIPSDGVANISGFYTLKIDDGARKTVTFHGWYANVTKQRHVWAKAWTGDWEGLDADTVGGFHALDFMLTQWKDLRTNKQFEDIFSTTLTNTHECWNKWCFVETTDLDNAPNMGVQWYEVFTGGIETRAFQFAISCFAHDRACYFRTKHDSVWSGWFDFATTADLANYFPLDGSVPITGIPTFVGGRGGSEGGEIALEMPEIGTLFDEKMRLDVAGNAVRFHTRYNGELKVFKMDFNSMVGGDNVALHTGNSAAVVQSDSAPSDTSALWYDTANKVLKRYVDGAWQA